MILMLEIHIADYMVTQILNKKKKSIPHAILHDKSSAETIELLPDLFSYFLHKFVLR